MALPVAALFEIGGKLLERVIPDPAARAKAQQEMYALQQSGEMALLQTQMSAIVAEATSPDPWTSRARPSFLYVIYLMILLSVPMGILSAFDPAAADNIIAGMRGYLAAIPDPLWALFGTGYLGYAGLRQWGKVKGSDR